MVKKKQILLMNEAQDRFVARKARTTVDLYTLVTGIFCLSLVCYYCSNDVIWSLLYEKEGKRQFQRQGEIT